MAVSYRRNRNYSIQFKWTYELNEDLFKCYQEAKKDPCIRYMNRMKALWDQIHPELASFTAKKLRDQASRVEKNKVVMATEYIVHKNCSNDLTHNETNLDIDNPPVVEINRDCNIETTSNITSISDNDDTNATNIKEFENRPFNERVYNNPINKNPSVELLKIIDDIASNYLIENHKEGVKPASLIDFNNYIYSSAITVNQHLGQLNKFQQSYFNKKIVY